MKQIRAKIKGKLVRIAGSTAMVGDFALLDAKEKIERRTK